MKSHIRAAIALLAAIVSTAAAAPPDYISLTKQFATFADATTSLSDDRRFARFQAEIAPLFPGFYEARDGQTPGKYREAVLRELRGLPAIRTRYEAVEAGFPAAYSAGIAHFRAAFPDFHGPDGVVFLHSLGQMDGGTRQIHGKSYLIFGADGIARYHETDSIGPFFDHELFHVEHARHFTDCDPVWCGLWQEGLATYAASTLNAGADDRMLMLETPQPIRAAVDARWRDALCLFDAKRNSIERADYQLFFFGNPNSLGFPPRFGYYLGFRLAQRAGKSLSLQQMTVLGHAEAKTLVEHMLADMVAEAGGCPAPAAPDRAAPSGK